MIKLLFLSLCLSCSTIHREMILHPNNPYTDLLLTVPELKRPSPAQITKAEALADVIILERILSKGAASYQAHDLNWGQFFSTLRQEIKKEEISSDQFIQYLETHFKKLGETAISFQSTKEKATDKLQTFISDQSIEVKKNSFYLSQDKLLTCPPYQLKDIVHPFLTANAPGIIHKISFRTSSPPGTIKCSVQKKNGTKESVAITLAPLNLSSNNVAPFVAIDGKIKELADKMRSQSQLFIDLRKIPAANSSAVKTWFDHLTSGELEAREIHEIKSDVTLQGDIITPQKKVILSKDRAQYEADYDNAIRYLLFHKSINYSKPFKKWTRWNTSWSNTQGLAPERFKGQIIILINRSCNQACLDFLYWAKQLKNTLILGEEVEQLGEFGRFRDYRLPHSKVWVTAPTRWYPFKFAVPDLWLDSLETITQCQKQNSCPWLKK